MDVIDIIDKYYPNTFQYVHEELKKDIINLIHKRTPEFQKLANENNISLDELLKIIYDKYDKFPYFVQNISL